MSTRLNSAIYQHSVSRVMVSVRANLMTRLRAELMKPVCWWGILAMQTEQVRVLSVSPGLLVYVFIKPLPAPPVTMRMG